MTTPNEILGVPVDPAAPVAQAVQIDPAVIRAALAATPAAVAPEAVAPVVVDTTDTTSDPTAPDEIISETPVTVGAEAIDAARAIVAQEVADVRNDRWTRSKRTLVQSALGAAAVAGFHAYSGGLHSWQDLAYAAGQAAATVVITYVHGRIQPAK